MSEPVIYIGKLAKSFGNHQVLRDVSLSIPAGQTFALLGRNGAGKTTTIRIMLGLAHRPPVVILDDPAMGLDPISRKEFNRDLVEHLQSSGCTVLYSSHLLDEVEAVADAVAILDQGKIVRTGMTEQLRDEVKQILLPLYSVAGSPQPDGLLDVRRHGDRLAIVTDQAGKYLQKLSNDGIEHDVVDLRLDEIFEAFVIGRKEDWPNEKTNAVVSV